jgi:3-methyladenine DNA glycosylase AlkD
MSADDGIYIMNFKDQSRVIYAGAIDNLWWSFVTFSSDSDEFVLTRIVEHYASAKPLSKEKAEKESFKLEKKILEEDDFGGALEYGICSFNVDKTWDEVVKDAKKLASKEIRSIRKQKDIKPDEYVDEIENLWNILMM